MTSTRHELLGRDQRLVHRLGLRAPSAALVRRGALLVEDAIRTASVPAGLVMLRRLDLGRIDPQRSPVALSQRIERAVRAARVHAVRATDPGAAGAEAVRFADEVEPFALLAAALSRGAAPRAWFWPRAVPGYAVHAAPADQVAAVLLGALDTRPGIAALVRVLEHVARHGDLGGLLAPLAARTGAELLARAGWTRTPGEPGVQAPAPADAPALADAPAGAPVSSQERAPALALLPASWSRSVARLVATWGVADARTQWLVTVALARAQPHAVADPGLPARARELAAALCQAPADARPGNAGEAGPAAAAPDDRPQAAPGARARGASVDENQPGGAGPDGGEPVTAAAPAPGAGYDGALPTESGGLLFLVQALRHLRIEDWLAAGDWPGVRDVPRQLLLDVALRLAVPAEDPMRLCLRDADERELPLPEPGSRASDAVRDWLERIHAFLLAHEGPALADLVTRPAKVIATPTHIDVFLPAWQADIRVRRLGLDLDPGWVPWLARVVLFHYPTAEEYGAL
jgi:hypothetical protein